MPRGLPVNVSWAARAISPSLPWGFLGIPYGGVYTGAFEIKPGEQAAIDGGTAGEQLDPCTQLACDTFDYVSLEVLELNTKAVAYAVLQYALPTEAVNGQEGKAHVALH